jgi:hypothetical protein
MNDERRPEAPHEIPATASTVSVPQPADTGAIPRQLRRRREASWRLPPLDDGRCDPLDPGAELHQGATFGMDPDGVRAEAERCRRDLGFLEWEIHHRFELESVAA